MNRLFHLLLVIISLSSCSTKKVFKNSDHETPNLYPSLEFNSEAAKNALEEGNSEIEGFVFTINKAYLGATPILTDNKMMKGVKVFLYPVTPYFDKWYDMKKDKKNKNVHVLMSEEALQNCLISITDHEGRFEFKNLKPGKYYLVTNITNSSSFFEENSSVKSKNSRLPEHQKLKPFYFSDSGLVEKFVKLRNEKQSVKVDLIK